MSSFIFDGRQVRAVIDACGKQKMCFVKDEGVYLCSRDEPEGKPRVVAYARGYRDPKTLGPEEWAEQRERQQADAGGDDFVEEISVEGWAPLHDGDTVEVELDKDYTTVNVVAGPRPRHRPPYGLESMSP